MNEMGCLLIHGFGGNRHELEPLTLRLRELGVRVSVPVLKGHESTVRELKQASRHDWIACAQSALDGLRASCKTVIVIGFSMGGLIATNLCRSNAVDGVVFLNTPVYYWGLKRMIGNLHDDFRASLKMYSSAFHTIPFHAMLEFQRLLDGTKPMFRDIGCQSLVLQSVHDDVVDPKSADYIFARLKGQKEFEPVTQGAHEVLWSSGCRQVCAYVQRFLKRFGAAPGGLSWSAGV